jgi:predicted transposase/invertase (TIGR01784 family)
MRDGLGTTWLTTPQFFDARPIIMKTGSIFYQIFLTLPQSFFDLIGESPSQGENYQFTSREVKQLSFRLDGLFLPTEEDSSLPLYLVEVQFQSDPDFYYRLFAEFFLFLKQYKPPHPWEIVVIYPSRSIEREQAIHFGDFLSLPSVRRIYLDELGEQTDSSLGVGVIKLIIESEQQAIPRAKALIEQTRNQLSDSQLQQQMIELVERIVVYKFPQKSREEIEAMFELSDLKQTRVYQEALAEGEAKLAIRLLNRKLGEIPPDLTERIWQLPVEEIESLGIALLDFQSLSELISWLER